jgi:hypothetical protein
MSATDKGAAEGICSACAASFVYDPAFYAARDLTPPRRCKPCRDDRAARLIEVPAKVEHAAAGFAFASAAGVTYYLSGHILHDVVPLHAGEPLMLTIDPEATIAPGRKPGAVRVRRP